MKIEKNNYITPTGYKKLYDEFELLTKVERPKTVEVVAWAASLGDRSENADYIYGKKRLREIDRRLRFLGKRIDKANIIDPLDVKSSKVQFGATVVVCDENGIEKTFCIVGEDESNAQRGLISWKSPVARALLTKEEGDDVIVRAPKGNVEYEIIEIRYEAIDFGESS
ncbi:transcription elongation factor GreB [Halobacteriovorax sp. GB3]|uniref:transcription elongation factor GreB n=1 Tax=Halobacteriovorax sp. GB3 TaxID=2719615 RepID=UPI00235DD652|nr:transcription elongation factor GreB [Halobacteriovorax sp. GB3]MDD0853974.1 transcription elongation factor GreB [Halobacteriovorax sp. GB3]